MVRRVEIQLAGIFVTFLALFFIAPSSFSSDVPNLKSLTPDEAFEKGRTYYVQEKFEKAKQCFQHCLDQEPKNSEYMCWMAQTIAFQLGEKAKQGASKLTLIPKGRTIWDLYETAVEINPKSERARIGYAILLRDLPSLLGGDIEKSEKLLKSVIEDNPGNIFAFHHLGQLYIKKKDNPIQGIRYLKQVLEIEDKRELTEEEKKRISGSYNALGKAFIEMGNIKVAINYLEQAVKRDPDNVVDMLALADAYVKLENKDEAKKTLRDAVAIIEQRNYKRFKDDVRKLAEKLNLSSELNL